MIDVDGLADAISDEFISVLLDYDTDSLQSLRADARSLRNMLPVGLTCAEAMLMIDNILIASAPRA